MFSLGVPRYNEPLYNEKLKKAKYVYYINKSPSIAEDGSRRKKCGITDSFLTREYESNERVIAFGGQISLARWAVNINEVTSDDPFL